MTNNHDDPQQILIPFLQEASSWGADDPKISKPYLLAKKIVEYLDCDDSDREEIEFLADRLLDKLESALMYYQLINAKEFDGRNISQKRTIYEGLYANLWSFYKGRVQNYLQKIGWNLSIFFCRDKNLDKEATDFIDKNPEYKDLVEMARKQRAAWQSDFANSRNTSEHSGDYRDGTKTYETKADAKRLFVQVCWNAETLIAYCGSYKMKREWNVIEINPGATVFDKDDRYSIEHAAQTTWRKRHSNNKRKSA